MHPGFFHACTANPLAVGRVMTPVLAMTVVREAAIAAFVPEKFYTVDLELTSGCTASSRRIPEKSVAENLLEACRKGDGGNDPAHHPQGKIRESADAV